MQAKYMLLVNVKYIKSVTCKLIRKQQGWTKKLFHELAKDNLSKAVKSNSTVLNTVQYSKRGNLNKRYSWIRNFRYDIMCVIASLQHNLIIIRRILQNFAKKGFEG